MNSVFSKGSDQRNPLSICVPTWYHKLPWRQNTKSCKHWSVCASSECLPHKSEAVTLLVPLTNHLFPALSFLARSTFSSTGQIQGVVTFSVCACVCVGVCVSPKHISIVARTSPSCLHFLKLSRFTSHNHPFDFSTSWHLCVMAEFLYIIYIIISNRKSGYLLSLSGN